MTSRIRRIGEIVITLLKETVYPRVCAGCGMRGYWLCAYCDETVPAATQPISCVRCGVPSLRRTCGCASLDSSITMARSAFVYDGWVGTAIRRTKYEGESDRASDLGERMAPLVGQFGSIDGLIPVPLYTSRERERGYNQSDLIARAISTTSGIPLIPVLRRSRQTASQVTLSGDDRQRNVKNAFIADPAWAPRPGGRYVLVDDVRTTGATLNACAEALRPHRPSMIGVLTFALDMHREDVQALRAYEQSKRSGVSVGKPPGATPPAAPTRPLPGRHRAP